ncbi:hypothetical protein AURDEDRAFT_175716 [Auricularia subglabra TFB-10046 SS5]|nr:hypothetical protein AURDEDRAFT_175716 [Auricularia subglabra TFB-10046 SS5]
MSSDKVASFTLDQGTPVTHSVLSTDRMSPDLLISSYPILEPVGTASQQETSQRSETSPENQRDSEQATQGTFKRVADAGGDTSPAHIKTLVDRACGGGIVINFNGPVGEVIVHGT